MTSPVEVSAMALMVRSRRLRSSSSQRRTLRVTSAMIVSCGFTHFFDVLTIWKPVYWSDGFVRVITAVASVGTALFLPTLVPKAVGLAESTKLAHDRGIKIESAYQELGAATAGPSSCPLTCPAGPEP